MVRAKFIFLFPFNLANNPFRFREYLGRPEKLINQNFEELYIYIEIGGERDK